MSKILSENIEKCWIQTKKGPILVLSYQDRARIKIGPFFDFLLHLSKFLLDIFSIASQQKCEAMLKISSKNIDKCRREPKKEPILVLS